MADEHHPTVSDNIRIDRKGLTVHAERMPPRPDILPPALLAALAQVGSRLANGDGPGAELDAALTLLAGLPPGQISRADTAIAAAANLCCCMPRSIPDRRPSRRSTDAEQLLRTPGLEYLFLFHRDGRLREAALLRITGGLPTPFLFAAVLWRLNDWAAPVRDAAARCADRSFPATAPAVVAQAAPALLTRQTSLSRWNHERALLDRALARDDVAEHLFRLIAGGATGPLASILRHALRLPALDPHLARIALESVQPSVRAVALDALLNGEAEWPSGSAWQWIDKSLGVRRRVTVFDHRPLTVAFPKQELTARGIRDRSAVVRRAALTAVIRHLPGTPEGRDHATALVADRSASVRERAGFILRQGRPA